MTDEVFKPMDKDLIKELRKNQWKHLPSPSLRITRDVMMWAGAAVIGWSVLSELPGWQWKVMWSTVASMVGLFELVSRICSAVEDARRGETL